jgi:glycosyltransferase involved in cell wall biosynthesis
VFKFRKPARSKAAGVAVFGYLKTLNGVGQAGRLIVQALNSVDYPVTEFDVGNPNEIPQIFNLKATKSEFNKVILSVDAHSIGSISSAIGKKFLHGKYVIAQWFWELEEVPEYYQAAFEVIDELWVPTEYMRSAFLAVAPPKVNIRHMPLPLVGPTMSATVDRTHFGIGQDFMFLFIFDFLSVMKRKNPIGLVEAFSAAFTENEGPILVIKTINGDKRITEMAQLKSACNNRKDIMILEQEFAKSEMNSLVTLCDSYVSMHRAEGLGLTLAEAMTAGKPVIATDYSGNLDFMNTENSILISWRRTEVGSGAEGYPATATWAEPDLKACASAMRELWENPSLARNLGLKAKESLQSDFSFVATGKRMVQRLEQI